MIVFEIEICPKRPDVTSLLIGEHISLETTVHFDSYMHYGSWDGERV